MGLRQYCRSTERQIKLGYAIIDEFHNFHLEKYRKPQFEPIKRLKFDGFEKVLSFSAAAPARIAGAALQSIGFIGLEKPATSLRETILVEKECLRCIRGCLTPMSDLVQKIAMFIRSLNMSLSLIKRLLSSKDLCSCMNH